MKSDVHPAFVAIAIVCIVIIAGFFLFRAATEKPQYPGSMAGKPGQGPMKGPPPGFRIPGRTPPSAEQPGAANTQPGAGQ